LARSFAGSGHLNIPHEIFPLAVQPAVKRAGDFREFKNAKSFVADGSFNIADRDDAA
jgi:hypothetical protein